MSRLKPPATVEELTRLWHEHVASLRGQTKTIADLKEALTRANTTIDQLRSAATAAEGN